MVRDVRGEQLKYINNETKMRERMKDRPLISTDVKGGFSPSSITKGSSCGRPRLRKKQDSILN